MPRKRQAEAQGQQRNTRVRAANSNDGDDAEVEEQPVQQTARREGMAEVARRYEQCLSLLHTHSRVALCYTPSTGVLHTLPTSK